MNYLQRNNQISNRRDNKRAVVILVILFFILAVIIFSPAGSFLKRTGTTLWKLSNAVSNFFVKSAFILKSKSSLISEKETLNEQIEFLKKDLFFIDILKKENEELKEILGRKKSKDKEILASILVKPGFSPYDIFIIDIGTENGVSVGDRVMVDGNTFIGKISEVESNMSKVRLYSSPDERVVVLIGPNNIQKEAVGLGGGNFMLELPKEMTVNEGDTITIPSIMTNVFGIVEKIEQKSSDSFQTVLFKSPVNLQEMRFVQVIIK